MRVVLPILRPPVLGSATTGSHNVRRAESGRATSDGTVTVTCSEARPCLAELVTEATGSASPTVAAGYPATRSPVNGSTAAFPRYLLSTASSDEGRSLMTDRTNMFDGADAPIR